MTRIRAALVFVGAIAGSACARPGASEDPSARDRDDMVLAQPFPTAREIAALTKGDLPPLPARLGKPNQIAVDEWTLEGPLPDRYGAAPFAADDATAAIVDEVARKQAPGVRVTAGMQCMAREIGRFALAHGGDPADDLLAFLALRCGTTVMDPRWSVVRQPRDRKSATSLRAEDRAKVVKLLEGVPANAELGVWIGADEDEVAMARVAGTVGFTLDDQPMAVGSDGFAEIRGRITPPPPGIFGVVTRDRHGFARCRAGLIDAQGGFIARCPVDPAEPEATIEIARTDGMHLLSHVVARIWVSPDGSLPTRYAAQYLPAAKGDDAAALLQAVNELRGRAGVKRLRHVDTQAQALARVVPHLQAAFADPAQTDRADRLALAVMAGWEVGEPIRGATFATLTGRSIVPAERIVAAGLASPTLRASLLDPSTLLAAVVPMRSADGSTRGWTIATYTPFAEADFAEEEAAVLDELDRVRLARDLPPVIRVQGPNDRRILDEASDRVRNGRASPREALEDVLDRFANASKRDFRGLVYTTLGLSGYAPPFEGELITRRHVAVAVEVGAYQPRKAAWAQHVVLVAYTVLSGPLPPDPA